MEDHCLGSSERDQVNAVPSYPQILTARLLQAPRIVNINNTATKCLIPFNGITVWVFGASIPFHSVYFLFYLQILLHRLVYILLLEQISLFSPFSYTQPFVMGCGAAVKKSASYSLFESSSENPMSCAFNINGETMLHGY